ncbi:hypothetical protein [Streptomyces sp. NPDC029004]|uniref:hypothetical protein n=1 Tax=Streptomyces sp. NPDC029004 TaxID=3154490 RepID=UPI0033D6C97E
MDTDPLTTLALTGAHTIVAAMATNAWESAQAAAARLFHRRGHALEAVEAQLAGDAALVEEDEDADTVRGELVGPWRRRLAALLREHPEAEDDLRAMVEEVCHELPQQQQSWVQNNTARDGGQLFAVQGGGSIHVSQVSPTQSRGSAPGAGADSGGDR